MAKNSHSSLSDPILSRLSQLPETEADFIKQLILDHPNFSYRVDKKFAFRPEKTIILGPPQPNFVLQTLHELGHALSKHKDYNTHVERIKIESEAWERAKTLYCTYQNPPIDWSDEYVEDSLDTYRDWLHSKSTCKKCGLTRYQSPDGVYHCPRCETFI